MLASVASLALLIFLVVGAAELWREHRELTRQMRDRTDAALTLSQGLIANALWNFDVNGLDMLARNLVREGAMVHAQVRSDDNRLLVDVWRDGAVHPPRPADAASAGPALAERELSLQVTERPAPIGRLTVQESYAEVDAEIRRRAMDRLPVELLKILAIALGILALLHRRVIARLSTLVGQLETLPLNDPQARIAMPADKPGQPDEIILLAGALNRFQQERAQEVQRRGEAEARLRDILLERSVVLAALRDGVLALDREHRVRYANQAVAHLLGLPERPQAGTPLQEVTSPAVSGEPEPIGAWLVDLCRDNHPQSAILNGLGPGGTAGALQVQSTPITGDHEVAWMVLLSDISDTLRSRQAEQARLTAEAANRAKSEFLSRMSHELRTPLNAIVGFAQTLGNDPVVQADRDRREWVQLIERAGWHLSSMIADVLDLSRIEAGSLRLDSQAVDLSLLVADGLAYVSADAEREGIHCEAHVDPAARWLQADAVRVQQVLLNLLSNAVKYNRRGGRVEIRLRLAPAHPGQVEIAVSDTGMGLDDAQQGALFQSFNRLGREDSGKPGTGIGLVITRGLVAMMDGELSVRSERGRGSCFTVRLPGVCSAPADGHAPEPVTLTGSTASDGTPRRLLYIEDDPVNAMVMAALIGQRPSLGLKVATTLAEGFAAIQHEAPELLLLDMQLPDGRGTDLLQTLRADPRWAGLPVIMVSADALDDSMREAMAAGANAYVTKPLDFDQLLRQIDWQLAGAAE